VNTSAGPFGLVPKNRDVTRTSTVPADPAGVTAVIDVVEFTVKLAAGADPNETAVTRLNPVPVMVTLVPPAVEPELGDTPVTTGFRGGW
jgi:hypothetical protein